MNDNDTQNGSAMWESTGDLVELGARHGANPAEASPAEWRYRGKHDTCGYRGRTFSSYLSALAAAENHIARCSEGAPDPAHAGASSR